MEFYRLSYMFVLSAIALILGRFSAVAIDMDNTDSLFNRHASPHARYKRDVTKMSNAILIDPHITNLNIESNVTARFATVSVTGTISNVNKESTEALFVLELPTNAFISDFKMVINHTVIDAVIYPKEEARKLYEDARERGESTGEVSSKAPPPGREMQLFAINVNVAAASSVSLQLTYKELLERRLGDYTQRISLKSSQKVEHIRVICHVWEPQGFALFKYRTPGSNTFHTTSTDSATMKATPNTRSLVYSPPIDIKQQENTDLSSGEFVIKYDVNHAHNGGLLLVDNNHFVHYFSPSGLLPMMKHIVFIIDISGSMGGQKILQTRDAMLTILDQLRPSDYVSMLVFSGGVKSWQSSPLIASPENIMLAKGFVHEEVKAGGSTNINGALLEGLSILERSLERGASAARMIVFLTDGQPSAGVIRTSTGIRYNIKQVNKYHFSIFSLGFGNNVDFDFLRALPMENGAFARKIYEDKDAKQQLEAFYEEISSPLLLDVHMDYSSDFDAYSLTRSTFPQYLQGSEIVVAGKVPDNGGAEIDARVVATRGGESQVVLETRSDIHSMDFVSDQEFTKQLWAYKKVKDLLEEMNVVKSLNDTLYAQLKERALNMSLSYSFVTPLTSLLVLQDDHGNSRNELGEDSYGFGIKAMSPNMSPSSASTISSGFLIIGVFCILRGE